METSKEVILEKVNNIKAGYSSFTEKKLASHIKEHLNKEGVKYTEDVTEVGSWIIPENKKE